MADYSGVTYDAFCASIDTLAKTYEWRYGQTMFNALLRLRPALAESIRSTPLDPFYRTKEDIPSELWNVLRERWDEPTSE